jgi:hypothetical protein
MRSVQYLALACFIATTITAAAQTPTDKVKLEVTRAELQIIGQGLMELPYKAAAPVMNDLQAQLNAYDVAAMKAAEDAKKPVVVAPTAPQGMSGAPAEAPVEKPAETPAK